jgi:hypothetical protein
VLDYERKWVVPALETCLQCELRADVADRVRLALSVITTRGTATSDEMCEVLGTRNWVIARRSKRIVERYGADVRCLTPAQYEHAETQAIERRLTR